MRSPSRLQSYAPLRACAVGTLTAGRVACRYYGVGCYHYIETKDLIKIEADVTRSAVQKSVCVLSRLPLFGLLHRQVSPSPKQARTHARIHAPKRTFANTQALTFSYGTCASRLVPISALRVREFCAVCRSWPLVTRSSAQLQSATDAYFRQRDFSKTELLVAMHRHVNKIFTPIILRSSGTTRLPSPCAAPAPHPPSATHAKAPGKKQRSRAQAHARASESKRAQTRRA